MAGMPADRGRNLAARGCVWANRRDVRLQANVVPRAGRMRPEFPAPPRVRAGRGFDSGSLNPPNKKIGPQACAWSPIFLFGGTAAIEPIMNNYFKSIT